MIVKCVKSTKDSETNMDDVVVGKEYEVYGICFSDERDVRIILVGENNNPNYYSLSFFEVIDSSIPHDWHFGDLRKSYDKKAMYNVSFDFMIGYKEFCENGPLLASLILHEDEGLRTFYRRKLESYKELDTNSDTTPDLTPKQIETLKILYRPLEEK